MLTIGAEPGDCGSRVVHDQIVVGCIVAGTRILPIAYMIPIAQVLNDISHSFGEALVTIADASFIFYQSFAGGSQTTSKQDFRRRKLGLATTVSMFRAERICHKTSYMSKIVFQIPMLSEETEYSRLANWWTTSHRLKPPDFFIRILHSGAVALH